MSTNGKQTTPKDSPQVLQEHPYKKGDIVWVLYRGKEYYPARVNAYYPKERKISHVWFPLNRASIKAIFKVSVDKVQPFTLESPLPENASEEIEYSYDQAMRILNGASIDEILEENDRYIGEQQQQQKASAKKSLSTADALRKSTGGPTPKSAASKQKGSRASNYHHNQTAAKQEPLQQRFESGDPIIVDTSIGMWPGIFHSYSEKADSDGNNMHYTLFPRDPSNEILNGKLANIVHFPPGQIEQSISEGVGSDMLMEALRDALQYVKVRNAEAASATKQQQLGLNTSTSSSSSTTTNVAAAPLPTPPSSATTTASAAMPPFKKPQTTPVHHQKTHHQRIDAAPPMISGVPKNVVAKRKPGLKTSSAAAVVKLPMLKSVPTAAAATISPSVYQKETIPKLEPQRSKQQTTSDVFPAPNLPVGAKTKATAQARLSEKRFRRQSSPLAASASSAAISAVANTAANYQQPALKKSKFNDDNSEDQDSLATEEEKHKQLEEEQVPPLHKEAPPTAAAAFHENDAAAGDDYPLLPAYSEEHDGSSTPTNGGGHHYTNNNNNSSGLVIDQDEEEEEEGEEGEEEEEGAEREMAAEFEAQNQQQQQQQKNNSQQKVMRGTGVGVGGGGGGVVKYALPKPSFFELASSDDAQRHIRNIWAEFKGDSLKEFLNAEFLQLDLRTGGLLSFKETENLISEVEKWLKTSSSIPAMTSFRQHFYIIKYVLPELCTFALSKEKDISIAEARRIFEDRREKTKQTNATSPNSLDTLVLAANMKIAEEQNGG